MTTTQLTPRRTRRGVVSIALLALLAAMIAAPAPASAAPTVPTDPVVSTAATTWQYLDDGTDPVRGVAPLTGWTASGFDDSPWKSARGSFGAKNGTLAPIGSLTPTTLLNHYVDGTSAPTVPTYFFRTTFDLAAGVADEVGSVTGDVVYDDALVVWINGTKVAGFVDGRVTGTTNQEYAGDSGGNPVASTFTANPDLLVDGTNTVAIALYQDRATSSDIYLDVPSIRLIAAADPSVPAVAAPSRVILTPTTTPESSQSISWLAGDASHATGQVQIRPSAGGAVRTIDAYQAGTVNNNPKQHYSTTVTGLNPATSYTYRVGLEGSWSEWSSFSTADPTETDFQFIYYGDAQIGLDSTWPSVVRQAEAKAPDSIGSVHAGDLIDSGNNETQWLNWFSGMATSAATTNVMAAPGNHEYSGDKKLAAWKANFEYPRNNPTTATIGPLAELAVGDTDVARQYAAYFAHWAEFAAETVYYTDYQGVRFITINATRDSTFLTPDALPSCSGAGCPSAQVARLWTQFQGAWLDHVLTESPSKWNVVTFHQPVFSTSAGRDEPVLREVWVPILQKHDVDLVLMGHDHTYGRGYLNSDATDTAGMTTGPVYAVSNSGAKHYDLETEAKNVWTANGATQVLRGAGVTTYQVIDVSADQLVYRSYLAEKTADATTDLPVGAVYDEFTITKDDAGAKWVTEAGVTPPVKPVDPVEPGEPGGPGTPGTPGGPDDAPAAIDPALLTDANRGGVTAPATAAPGQTISVDLGRDRAGASVWAWLYSAPTLLGAVTVDAAGTITVTLPADAAEGEHRIVVQATDGSLVGWAPLQVARPSTIVPGATPAPGTSAAPITRPGAATTSTGGKLAVTGAEPITILGIALVLLVAGGLATVAVRRRRLCAGPASSDDERLS